MLILIDRKAKDEYVAANNRLEAVRKDYRSVRAQYDFLAELDEIANFKVADLDNLRQMMDDDQEKGDRMEIEKENVDPEPKQSATKETKHETRPRNKKVKMNFDPDVVFSVEVEQDITMAQLEILEKMFDDIKLKHSQIEEKLKSLQPNVTSINEYKKRVIIPFLNALTTHLPSLQSTLNINRE